MDSVLASHPAAPGSNPGVQRNSRLIDSAAAQSSGQQGLNNVDRAHLVLWIVASWYYKKVKCKITVFAEFSQKVGVKIRSKPQQLKTLES